MLFQKWRLNRRGKLLLGTAIVAVVGLNGLAWMHARAMTHFVEGGWRTPSPERMSFGAKVWTVLTGVRIPRPENKRNPKDIGLPYQTHRIPISGGESLEGWFVPKKASRGIVVMFHPYKASKDALLAPAAVFHELEYDLLLVDFRGSGGSSSNDTTIGWREAKDVASTVAYVQQTASERPIVLYGVSMGAVAIARAIAVEQVRPSAIILESAFDRFLVTMRHRFEAMGLPAFPAAELLVFWGGVQHGFNGFAHNPDEYAIAIECPTLMLHGEQDARVTTEEAIALFKNVRGRKHLEIFSEAGHELLVTVDAPRWKREVAKFLGTVKKN